MSSRHNTPAVPPSLSMSDADIGEQEIALVTAVLRSRELSGGPVIERFEASFAERIGTRFAVAVSSGTAGLHLALAAAGVADGDLVLTTPYSFVASANVALYQRALPVFVDIDPVTLNIDPTLVLHALDDLEGGGARRQRWLKSPESAATGRVKAILPVHVFGQPAAMDPIVQAARERGVAVIEDACEGLGAEYCGRPVGTLGDAAVFGFFPNKQITTAEGGMIVTNDAAWAELYRSLRNQGRDDGGAWLSYSRLGYNYRLDELSAALGLVQTSRLGELLAKREGVAKAYGDRLHIPGVQVLPLHATTTRRSWFVYVVRFTVDIDRDAVMRALADDGIPSRPYFPSIHLQPFYRDRFGFRPGDFPHAEAASRSTLALPFHANLSTDAVDYVVTRLAAAVARCRGRVTTPVAEVKA